MITTTLSKDYQDKPHESVPCPLCDKNDDAVLATRGYPGIPLINVICKGCGLIRINPRMTREGYEAFYKEDFFEYLNPYSRPAYVEEIEHTTDDAYDTPTKRRILPYIRDYVQQGARVLDIGAGFGQVLYLLRKEKGAVTIGIEPDPFSRAVARDKLGVDLLDTTIEDFLATTDQRFDFIYMDQVFEHLLTPLETLVSIANILAPKGVMYIGVPNAWNPQMSMDLFYQLAHTYNYTPAVLRAFATRANLKIISIRDPESYALEILVSHIDSPYPEEDVSRLIGGKSWSDTVRRLRRKRYLNQVRGLVKQVLISLGGEKLKERIRSIIDRAIHYTY